MTTLIPSSQPTGVEAYEDMFKEITRKLYGEETGHGLHTLGTPVAHVATGGPTAPEGERSFTTLISDRSLATIDYDHVGSDTSNLFKSDDHLTTAFGLAALMQNGFPPPGAILNPHNFVANKPNSIITSTASTVGNTVPTVTAEDKWPTGSTDDCLPWTTNKSNFNVPQKIFKVKKQEHIDHDINIPQQTANVQANNVKPQTNTVLNAPQAAATGLKRYNCTSCPYSTDRRDLFTRHENIHKEEKPFHCYVCLKQFNRADHVKKHFLRMHRGLAYDLSRTKRSTANGRKATNFFVQQPKQEPNQQGYQQATTLTIPTNTYQSSQHQQQQQNQVQQQQQQQQQQHHQQNNADVRGSNPSEAESHVLSFLIEVMRKLNADPGSFESYQKELNSLYLEYAHNEFVISNAIEIIFDQSINEQNFRYMGARICRLLDALDASPDSVFRHLLRLKMNYNQEENMAFITNDAHKVRGTTLFLAELYIQLQNDGHRIGDVAKSIYKAISLLLQKTTPENIKCVCQTLKLCGYELEIDFPMEAADVLSILKQVKDIDVSTERLLKSVLELSQNRWGRTEAVLNAPIIEHNIQPNYSNDPVFYGPDGEIITEEESKFLSDIPAYPNFDYCEDSNDADELAEPEPEMDLEIQMAFKDFVKSQHNQK